MKTLVSLAGALLLATPAMAATTIVISPLLGTDSGAVPACAGAANSPVDRLCVNNGFIGNNFGTTTNLTALFSVEAGGNWVRFGNSGGGEFVNSNDVTTTLTLTPGAGYELRMISFDDRRRTATGGLVPTYSLVDLDDDSVVWNLTTPSFSGSRTTAVNSIWSAAGLAFSWSNEGSGSLGLRNLTFELREIDVPPPPPPIPEPASWAMMIAGFGLVGTAARRRRTPRVTA